MRLLDVYSLDGHVFLFFVIMCILYFKSGAVIAVIVCNQCLSPLMLWVRISIRAGVERFFGQAQAQGFLNRSVICQVPICRIKFEILLACQLKFVQLMQQNFTTINISIVFTQVKSNFNLYFTYQFIIWKWFSSFDNTVGSIKQTFKTFSLTHLISIMTGLLGCQQRPVKGRQLPRDHQVP